MKPSVKITIASIAALILVAAGIIAAPLLNNLLNDIAHPAYNETEIFPNDSRTNPKDTMICFKGIEIKMIGIRGGKIHCEGLRNEVELADFYLAETEVTQGLWKAVMGDNPSGHQDGDEFPVEIVDLIDCLEFVCKLDSLSGIAFTIQSYPEWLYATHLGGVANCDSSLTDKAWFEENSDGTTHPVKQKQADGLGLYDMLGNVAEWTISGSDPLFFTVGGSYESDKSHCSAAVREIAHAEVALGSIGLRLSMPVIESTTNEPVEIMFPKAQPEE